MPISRVRRVTPCAVTTARPAIAMTSASALSPRKIDQPRRSGFSLRTRARRRAGTRRHTADRRTCRLRLAAQARHATRADRRPCARPAAGCGEIAAKGSNGEQHLADIRAVARAENAPATLWRRCRRPACTDGWHDDAAADRRRPGQNRFATPSLTTTTGARPAGCRPRTEAAARDDTHAHQVDVGRDRPHSSSAGNLAAGGSNPGPRRAWHSRRASAWTGRRRSWSRLASRQAFLDAAMDACCRRPAVIDHVGLHDDDAAGSRPRSTCAIFQKLTANSSVPTSRAPRAPPAARRTTRAGVTGWSSARLARHQHAHRRQPQGRRAAEQQRDCRADATVRSVSARVHRRHGRGESGAGTSGERSADGDHQTERGNAGRCGEEHGLQEHFAEQPSRPAPSAALSDSSAVRRRPVRISRLATLPHAISRTSPATRRRPAAPACASSSTGTGRVAGGRAGCGILVAAGRPVDALRDIEHLARVGLGTRARSTPGFRRTRARRPSSSVPVRQSSMRWRASSGTQTSTGSSSMPAKPRGPTATMVWVRCPSRSGRPMTSAALLKRCCQSAWLITTAPGSEAVGRWGERRAHGLMPRTSK